MVGAGRGEVDIGGSVSEGCCEVGGDEDCCVIGVCVCVVGVVQACVCVVCYDVGSVVQRCVV